MLEEIQGMLTMVCYSLKSNWEIEFKYKKKNEKLHKTRILEYIIIKKKTSIMRFFS